MKTFDHWVVGLDLTKMDDIILGYINYFASIQKPQKITFIHFIEDATLIQEISGLFSETEDQPSLNRLIYNELEQRIKEHLDSDSPDITIHIFDRDPAKSLLSWFDEQNPDLLVMGKKSGYEGEGSIVQTLSRYAPCSLLLVAENSRYEINNIHIPVSFNQASAHALRYARRFSAAMDANLHIQHVYRYPKQFFPYIPSEKYKERLDSHLQEKWRNFKEKFDLSDTLDCTFTVNAEGKEADQIYDSILSTQADFIILGAKGRAMPASLFSEDLADQIIGYRFGIPILIYKEVNDKKRFFRELFNQ